MAMKYKLVSRLGLTPQSFRGVTTYYLSYVALGTVSPSLGIVLPFLAERTGVTMELASSMLSVESLGFMLGSLVVGRVLERFPAHGVIPIALLVMALTLVALSVAPMFSLILLLLLTLGFFAAWLDVGSNLLMIWQLREKVPSFLTGMHFVWGIGTLFTPLIIVQLQMRTGTLLAPFALIALILVACSLLYVRLPSPISAQTAEAEGMGMPKIPVSILIAMLFLIGTMEMVMAGFGFTYLLSTALFSKSQAAEVISTYYAVLTCTRLISVFLLTRYSSQRVVIAALTSLIGAAMMVLLLPITLTGLWVAIFFCGIGLAVPFPLTLTWVPEYVPAVGKVTSLMYSSVSVGALTIPLLIGQLFENPVVGPQVIWYYFLAGSILFMGCLLALHFIPRLTLPDGPTIQTSPATD